MEVEILYRPSYSVGLLSLSPVKRCGSKAEGWLRCPPE